MLFLCIVLALVIGSINHGWPLLFVWLMIIFMKYIFLHSDTIREKVSEHKILKISFLAINFLGSMQDYNLVVESDRYRNFQKKQLYFTSIIGLLVIALNIYSDARWIKNLLAQLNGKIILYLAGISVLFSIIDKGEEKLVIKKIKSDEEIVQYYNWLRFFLMAIFIIAVIVLIKYVI